MATTPNLLSIPLEIRRQIYSHLFPKAVNMNIVRDNMDRPLRNNLFLLCRQIHHEAFEYYYSTNTFLLDLTEPAYAPNRFINGTKGLLKYIGRVQFLQLVIGDAFSQNDDPLALSEYAREQFDWFLRTLWEVHQNHEGLWLKNLIVVDQCQTSISKGVTPQSVERGVKRREAFVRLLEPFRSRIRDIRIESRGLSKVGRYDTMHDRSIGIMAAEPHTSMEILII